MTTMQLEGALRQSEARAVAAALTEALADADVTVDLVAVSQIDAGILQVLISASALADRTGRRLYVNMPEGCAALTMARSLALPAIGLPLPAEAAA